jgi:hypothetical protein
MYQTNFEICIYILLNYHLINTIRNSNMFQPLKGRLQGAKLILTQLLRNTVLATH